MVDLAMVNNKKRQSNKRKNELVKYCCSRRLQENNDVDPLLLDTKGNKCVVIWCQELEEYYN